jgi:two-component system sensor histidine kinase PilS (NtrC family)
VVGRDPYRLLGPLAWARLGLAAVLFAVAPVISSDLAVARDPRIALVVGAVASGAILLFVPRHGSLPTVSLLCLLDVAAITGVITLTGGPHSLFTFLYVPSVTAAAVLLPRPGSLAVAAAASSFHIGVVFLRTVFPITMLFEPVHDTTALETLTMFLNSGTLLIVAIVAGGLAEQFRSTHQALEQQTRTLRDVEAFKDLVFESVATGLIALDRNHVVTAFNPAAERITGRSAAAALGARWTTLFGTVLGLDAIDATIGADPRRSTRHEVTLVRPDGTVVPVRLTFSGLHAGDDARVGLIATCEDLSAIREMEQRMRQADRLATLGRMSANIAHEIRNPLASLSGAVEALTSEALGVPERGRLAQIVLRESDRLNTIIKNFLDYARPAPLTVTPVEVTDLVEDVLVLVEHRAEPPHLKIRRDLPSSLVWPVDAQQMRQAIWNLCLNAIEAMPDGGELGVTAGVHDDRLCLELSDTGAGIADEHLEHVFEPFFSTKAGGSGLGLAVVHRIAQDHEGSVDVRSTTGTGTTFTLRLPRPHD